jgi:predicted Zn-dependent peptidase
LIAVGDIDEAAFFEQATTEFTLPHKSPAAVTTTQSTGIRQAYVKKYMPIATPVFSIGFKENSFDLSPISRTVYSEVLTDILIGSGSVLFEKLYNNGLCTQPLGIDYICGKDYGISTVFGTSANPQRLLTLLHKEVENYLSYGISEQTLKRIIEKNKGKLMQNMDSIDFCCNFVSDNFVKSIKTLDFCDKYDSINNDELMHRLKEHFKPDNLCLSEIIPL